MTKKQSAENDVLKRARALCTETHGMPYRQPCWACCQVAQACDIPPGKG